MRKTVVCLVLFLALCGKGLSTEMIGPISEKRAIEWADMVARVKVTSVKPTGKNEEERKRLSLVSADVLTKGVSATKQITILWNQGRADFTFARKGPPKIGQTYAAYLRRSYVIAGFEPVHPTWGFVSPDPKRKEDKPQFIKHTLVEGDSLYALALRYYGNPQRWRVLLVANFDKDVDDAIYHLKPGTKLRVPLFPMKAKPDALPRVIFAKRYKIFSAKDGKELGIFSLKVTEDKRKGEIEFVDETSMEYRGKKMEYISRVTYKSAPLLAPVFGEVETKVDGQVCMKGSVTISEKSLSYRCTIHLDDRTGEPINPPRLIEKKDRPRPAGPIVFQSALFVLGPRLVPAEGELKQVVFAEFPDDIDAIVNFKENYRLVRTKADDKGNFEIQRFSPRAGSPLSFVTYDAKGGIVSLGPHGKVKYVEIPAPAKVPHQ